MTSLPVRIPSFFLDFMDSVNVNRHDSIVMRANAVAADDACLELDVRLHSTEPDLRYMIGLVDEDAYFDHPETGEALFSASHFIETLGFPEDTPRLDDFYLGPFTEEAVLEIMAAADHTAARLDADKHVACLRKELERAEKVADSYRKLSSERGNGLVAKHGELETARKREERKGLFRVIEGGKLKTPAAG